MSSTSLQKPGKPSTGTRLDLRPPIPLKKLLKRRLLLPFIAVLAPLHSQSPPIDAISSFITSGKLEECASLFRKFQPKSIQLQSGSIAWLVGEFFEDAEELHKPCGCIRGANPKVPHGVLLHFPLLKPSGAYQYTPLEAGAVFFYHQYHTTCFSKGSEQLLQLQKTYGPLLTRENLQACEEKYTRIQRLKNLGYATQYPAEELSRLEEIRKNEDSLLDLAALMTQTSNQIKKRRLQEYEIFRKIWNQLFNSKIERSYRDALQQIAAQRSLSFPKNYQEADDWEQCCHKLKDTEIFKHFSDSLPQILTRQGRLEMVQTYEELSAFFQKHKEYLQNHPLNNGKTLEIVGKKARSSKNTIFIALDKLQEELAEALGVRNGSPTQKARNGTSSMERAYGFSKSSKKYLLDAFLCIPVFYGIYLFALFLLDKYTKSPAPKKKKRRPRKRKKPRKKKAHAPTSPFLKRGKDHR